MIKPQYYYTETENGSPVEIKVTMNGNFTAWSRPTRNEHVFIDLLCKADLKIIEDLGLPRWYFDFTGKGMVFDKFKQEYVSKTQLEALKLKTPYRNEK